MAIADVNGTQLSYIDVGPREATPIVFSHSLFFDHTMFAALIDRFSDDYRVVAYDHRGQGSSAPGTREELSVDNLTLDAAALIEHLELSRCHVVGNSLGGFVALRLAARHPELVLSAVAVGSSAEEEHKLDEFAPLVDHVAANGVADVLDTLVYIMFGDTSISEGGPALLEWRGFMSELEPRIADAAHGVIHRTSIVSELQGTSVPILAIAGAEDHAYPPPISSTNIADASGGRHVTVDKAGHSVSLEQHSRVGDILAEHFSRVVATT
jgi:3-oxoadipate enol-lactonase